MLHWMEKTYTRWKLTVNFWIIHRAVQRAARQKFPSELR